MLPPKLKDVLGRDHRVFLGHRVGRRWTWRNSHKPTIRKSGPCVDRGQCLGKPVGPAVFQREEYRLRRRLTWNIEYVVQNLRERLPLVLPHPTAGIGRGVFMVLLRLRLGKKRRMVASKTGCLSMIPTSNASRTSPTFPGHKTLADRHRALSEFK